MRDTRESRLLLVLLVAVAFALITVDIRGGDQSPLDGVRSAAASVFGPVENGVASAVNPVGNAIEAVRDSGARHDKIAELQQQNEELKQKLGSSDVTRNRATELDKLLKTAGAGQYGIKAAQVIAIGATQGFSWTITIDAGSNDGIQRDQTVINGDGLVGRVTTVGPSTSTVLLAVDPDFTVGARMEKSMELGFSTGQGDRPMRVQLLNGKANVKPGDRMVTFGSQGDKPFVPGVPLGQVVGLDPGAGGLTRTVEVQPFVAFSRLDIVGVVVVAPRQDPRDSVLPPAPKATPTPTVTVTVSPSASGSASPSSSDSPSPSGSPSPSPSAS
ncbi:rod shape-determining protein MreC [Streptantibioticus ferralitis]|uniref:Cell shape-determining protein MreC n=1 Tax=Streptantibioticus ferralitis TaxID=236510 RepID=A0ABT5Z2S5_9ACTN|nr:rod shape-determining protein MreC [Streptantibioticus ferralitis]MDF2258127.1 rod shape-determining protein MreC [Streptantibioticus ferralitis]